MLCFFHRYLLSLPAQLTSCLIILVAYQKCDPEKNHGCTYRFCTCNFDKRHKRHANANTIMGQSENCNGIRQVLELHKQSSSVTVFHWKRLQRFSQNYFNVYGNRFVYFYTDFSSVMFLYKI